MRMKYRSQAIDLLGGQAETVIRKPSDHRVDGIVTGVIVNVLAFPLLIGAIALGLWMLYVAATEGAPIIIVVMGIGFVFGGLGLIRLFAVSQMAFFPVKWTIRRLPDGLWSLKKHIAGIRVFKRQSHSWALQCCPSYSRGDWGYYFIVNCGAKRIRFSPPAVFTDSKTDARRLAEEDAKALRAHFGIKCELIKWE